MYKLQYLLKVGSDRPRRFNAITEVLAHLARNEMQHLVHTGTASIHKVEENKPPLLIAVINLDGVSDAPR